MRHLGPQVGFSIVDVDRAGVPQTDFDHFKSAIEACGYRQAPLTIRAIYDDLDFVVICGASADDQLALNWNEAACDGPE